MKESKNKKGLKVDILTPLSFGGPQKWGDDLVRALKNEGIEARNIHSFWGIFRRFFWTDAHIIHTTLPLWFNLQGKKIILTLKGDFRREKNIWSFLYPLAIKKANRITIPSKFLKKELNVNEAIIIPNGVFLHDYKIADQNEKETFEIITVTGFSFWDKAKGILELFKILSDVKKLTDKKFKFTIVGGGKHLEKVKEESEKFDLNYEFIGFHPNPQELLQKSDLFIYYSYFDNQPNAILQAMACGLPVISNDVGDVNNILSEPRILMDKNEIAKIISNRSYRITIANHLQKRVSINYSWENIVKVFIQLYYNA